MAKGHIIFFSLIFPFILPLLHFGDMFDALNSFSLEELDKERLYRGHSRWAYLVYAFYDITLYEGSIKDYTRSYQRWIFSFGNEQQSIVSIVKSIEI